MKTLLIALAVATASVVFAAEPPTEDVPDAKAPATNEPTKGKDNDSATKPDSKNASSPDVFVPSESISEDLAIPLPVDI
jgi:hypothetical protein